MNDRIRIIDVLGLSKALEGLGNQLATLTTSMGQAVASIQNEQTTLVSETSALAEQTQTVSASLNGTNATVRTLSSALIDRTTGVVVARWGVNLNADGVVTSIEAIAQGGANPRSQVRFRADLQSEDFETGVAGWQITGAGDAEFNSVIIRNAIITNDLEAPSVSPAGGLISGATNISVTVPSGADVVRYTTNGSQVTRTSQEWPRIGAVYTTLGITSTTILRVQAFSSAGQASEEITELYTLDSTTSKVATPTIRGPGGITGNCHIECATAGATVYYLLNFGAPQVYAGPFSIDHYDEVVSYATKAAMIDSSSAYLMNLLKDELPP